MAEEEKSQASFGSRSMINGTQAGDTFSKVDEVIFSFFFPLYEQKRKPSELWHVFMIIWEIVQMTAMSMYSVDTGTNEIDRVSQVVGYLDGSQLSLVLGKFMPYLNIGIFGLELAMIGMMFAACILYRYIIASQPWILSFLRGFIEVKQRMLYIWITNINISSFDCYSDEDGLSHWRADPNIVCFNSDIFQIIGAVIAIINLIVFFSMSIVLNIAIYNHNPKNGGLLSCPNGTFPCFQNVLLFGVIFVIRFLYQWPFWRGFLSIGISLVIVLYLVLLQPYYSFMSNFLSTLQWSIFGSLRFCMEIGYSFEKSTNNIIPSIVFIIIGVALSCAIITANNMLINRVRKKQYFLKNGRPHININTEEGKTSTMPKIKNPNKVEPSVRFLQLKYMRNLEMYNYVDHVYTTAIKRHKSNPYLYFLYANFLCYYKKNWVKSQSVYRQARISSPSIILRFVLYCKTKEGGRGSGDSSDGEGAGSELSSLAFKATMALAIEHHEMSRNALKTFFENMTMINPNYSVMAEHLSTIVEEEAKGRKCFEELLATHPQNTAVLRSYARLLIDIYQDEDTAEMLLARADRIEEDQGVSVTGDRNLNNHGQLNAQNEADAIAGQQIEEDAQNNKRNRSNDNMSQNKSIHHKKKKQKKKEDTVMTEITTGSQSNSKLGIIIGGLLFGAHILAIVIYCVSLGVYFSQANRFEMRLTNLKRVCDVASFSTELAPLAMMYMVHEFDYNFSYPGSIDGQSGVIRTFDLVQSRMKEHSEKIVSVTSNIYEMTTLTEPWEDTNLESQIFMTGDANCTDQNGIQSICEGMVLDHQLQETNLLRALTLLAQKGYSLGTIKEDPHIMSTYHQDLTYICFNSMSPILAACKRAMISYWEDTNQLTSEILVIFIVVIVVIMVGELAMLIITYVFFSIKIIRERRNAFQQVLEVPKQKMQGVIRRLLQGDQNEDDDKENQTFSQIEQMENEIDQNFDETDQKSAQKQIEGKKNNSLDSHSNEQQNEQDQKEQTVQQEDIQQDNNEHTPIGKQLSRKQTIMLKGRKRSVQNSKGIEKEQQKDEDSSNNNQNQENLQFQPLDSQRQQHASNMISHNGTPIVNNINPTEEKEQNDTKSIEQTGLQQQQQDQANNTKIPGQTDISALLKSLGLNSGSLGNQQTSTSQPSQVASNTQNLIMSPTNLLNSVLGSQSNMISSQTGANQQGISALQQMVTFNPLNGSTSTTGTNLINQTIGSPPNSVLQPQSSHFLQIIHPTPQIGLLSQQQNMSPYANQLVQSPILSTSPQIFSPMQQQQQQWLQQQQQFQQQQMQMQNIQNNIQPSSPPNQTQRSHSPFYGLQGVVQQAVNIQKQQLQQQQQNQQQQSEIQQQQQQPQQLQQQQQQQVQQREQQHRQIQYVQQGMDDDDENEQQKGFLRQIIEDPIWEESLDQDIAKLQNAYTQLPSPITIKFIINIVVSLAAELLILAALIVVVVVYVGTAANIVMSGMRPAYLAQMHYLNLRLLYTYPHIEPKDNITLKNTNPVWKDKSHVMANRTDDILDSMSTRRLDSGQTVSSLLKNSSCYMQDTEKCEDQPGNPEGVGIGRIFSTQWPVSGLSSLLSRMNIYIEQLNRTDLDEILDTDFLDSRTVTGGSSGASLPSQSIPSSYNNRKGDTNDQIRFIVTAIRNDMSDGMKSLTDSILQSGIDWISMSTQVLMFSVIGCSVVQLVMVIINAIPWSQDVVRATNQSRSMLQLLPVGPGSSLERGKDGEGAEKEIQLLPSMRTGGRERIVEAALILIQQIKAKETLSVLLSQYQTLMQVTLRQFSTEEKEMIERGYSGTVGKNGQKGNVNMEEILNSGPGELGPNASSLIEANYDQNANAFNVKNAKMLPQNQQNQQNQANVSSDQNTNTNQTQPGAVKEQKDNKNDDNTKDEEEKGFQKRRGAAQALINTNNDPKLHNYMTHAREHIVLRQRITILGDQLKVDDDGASKMIAKRNLIKLFDGHFTNADVVFGNTIPADEKIAVKEGEVKEGQQQIIEATGVETAANAENSGAD